MKGTDGIDVDAAFECKVSRGEEGVGGFSHGGADYGAGAVAKFDLGGDKGCDVVDAVCVCE